MIIQIFNKRYIIFVSIIGLLTTIIFSLTVLSGRSVTVMLQTLKSPDTIIPAEAGKTVCVLKDIDFDVGEWAAYIVTAQADLTALADDVPKHNFLQLTDKAILKEMQRDWCFKVTGGDVATVESYVVVLKNGVIQWESGIVIENNYEGLQSSQYGWVTPINEHLLSEYAKKFNTSIYPLHII